ncbi:maltose acetyltransferase domain-containing protein [Alteromonas gilva]|uniref:Maltose acetyltransferase domain-containing protein n=1 Tax=Alteromonas gilva TaxID=2987522 RepID=A0ABT5L3X6_9ALTE|nr:maltose acetyltransferase domain-containing protein [Alteromonas gilva]MDC8831553.1 maltose acetyltransferase domain-containing protein [Alteromonas gilva]
MTQAQDIWQQMLSGQWYQTQHPTLVVARERAKALCWRLNNLPQTPASERHSILTQLLPNVSSVTVGAYFGCDYGVNIYAGSDLLVGRKVVMLDPGIIRLGHSVTIADNVVLATLTHPLESDRRKAGWQQTAAITVGNNVTLGEGCSVLPGANIPDDTDIGAGAVVTASTSFSGRTVGI